MALRPGLVATSLNMGILTGSAGLTCRSFMFIFVNLLITNMIDKRINWLTNNW